MITRRKAQELGHADHVWLDSLHSFSFAEHHEPRHMGVGNLRVINEDRIAPGTGFGTHGHRDMEIIRYVLDGALAHKDSMGNEAHIVPGEVQRMSAGTGVRHSEHNHAPNQTTHFLQIWILPDEAGGAPRCEQKYFDPALKRGKLALVVSPGGAGGSVSMRADARLYAGLFDGEESLRKAIDPARPHYMHLVRCALTVNGQPLLASDAVTLPGEGELRLSDERQAEVLYFDLAP
jgi:quercetin 2,3-dioxygenase